VTPHQHAAAGEERDDTMENKRSNQDQQFSTEMNTTDTSSDDDRTIVPVDAGDVSGSYTRRRALKLSMAGAVAAGALALGGARSEIARADNGDPLKLGQTTAATSDTLLVINNADPNTQQVDGLRVEMDRGFSAIYGIAGSGADGAVRAKNTSTGPGLEAESADGPAIVASSDSSNSPAIYGASTTTTGAIYGRNKGSALASVERARPGRASRALEIRPAPECWPKAQTTDRLYRSKVRRRSTVLLYSTSLSSSRGVYSLEEWPEPGSFHRGELRSAWPTQESPQRASSCSPRSAIPQHWVQAFWRRRSGTNGNRGRVSP